MDTPVSRWRLREAARCIDGGGIVAYPTEAVYGLGCHPLDADAVFRLLALKQRSVEKGLILIAADFRQLTPYVRELDAERMAHVFESWPGPHTWLLPTPPHLPYWLKGSHSTLAVRVTAHPLAAALCRACGSALISTSANVASRPPARSSLQVRLALGQGVDYILSGPLGEAQRPSTIRDARTGNTIRF